jgi:tRNA (guanine37-N1)-methyltransferase
MRFTVVTIFPEMFASVLEAGVVGRAVAAGAIQVGFVNPRDFTSDRHRTVDDTPYGGGPGMVMKVEPLVAAIEAATGAATGAATEAAIDAASQGAERPHRILLAAGGRPLDQQRVRELAGLPHLVLVCGRYEGVDERVVELAIDEELSVGDFVLTGGELGAMSIIDAVARHVPGVLGEAASAVEESFAEGLVEYPQYTRPLELRGLAVPEILQSGHHARIRLWRRQQALARTARRRPDLLAEHRFSDEDRRLWSELAAAEPARRTYVALVHHPVYDRHRRVVTSAVTNFDVHDIARASATYGLAGYFVVTPVAVQREKVERIMSVWSEELAAWQGAEPSGFQDPADHRGEALALVRTAADLPEVQAALAAAHGQPPLVVATSARPGRETVGFEDLRAELYREAQRPALLVFGTGWGLADEVVTGADRLLAPVGGRPRFNHLSVRSAVAVILDRLFGQCAV